MRAIPFQGETLSVALVVVTGPDLLRVYSGFESQNKDVTLNGKKIADLSYPQHQGMTFTFVDGLGNGALDHGAHPPELHAGQRSVHGILQGASRREVRRFGVPAARERRAC